MVQRHVRHGRGLDAPCDLREVLFHRRLSELPPSTGIPISFYIDDSWDVLQDVVYQRSAELGIQKTATYLAGSSAGALI